MKKLFSSLFIVSLLMGCSSQNTKTTSQEKVAQNGDYVNIDFVGKLDGEVFDGGSGEDYELKLGSDTMIDGFEDGIVGMKLNEEKTITVTFPEEYVADLAGKEATFDITLNKIYRETESSDSVFYLVIRRNENGWSLTGS